MTSELVRGDGGVFDVSVDGVLVFSKQTEGRYPVPQEILDAIDSREPKES